MRVVICDILYQVTHCHFQVLVFALNQSCLRLEERQLFPVSSTTYCYCLSCRRQRAAPIVSNTDTQRPPDSRMNRSSKHPDRLSLGRLLLSASLVTSPTQFVSNLASSHTSNHPSKTRVATFACNKDSLSVPSHKRLSSHLRSPADPIEEGAPATNLVHEVCEPT
jgi:hypothetical protein